ncbi:ribonuclease T2 [Andreprevotia lacus DSM 23236]|jgi:ribonuclease T2|uniref:Ribonuclease T2 n=1 Tax=Andreprevotia lacus DSM 23236 TaxID=1121001 RepID=A0A1W1Y0Z7_9NEIS|nr:ribonuclease T2 [Andreprevotia lacus]SMC29428.1 ribonuclease T2 [Andreprevotia lacus DSM 23236]
MRPSIAVLLLLALCASVPAHAKRHHPRNEPGNADAASQGNNVVGQFDYLALSLSWAPSYCASHPQDQNECGTGKRYGFVLHGLWPQYENGGWPQNCSSDKLSPASVQQYGALYPSPNLMSHEWEKHGTCYGQSQDAYFKASGQLKNGVQIPATYQQPAQPVRTTSAALAADFLKTNPSLKPGSVLAVCNRGFLTEIHVCYGKDLQSRTCGAKETAYANKGCSGDFLVRNIR